MTFIFSTTDHVLSRFIRWMSKSKVSHCAVGLVLYGQPFVLSSSLLGVEMVTRERWLQDNRVVVELSVPTGEAPHPSLFLSHLGEGYDYSGMLGYLFIWLARWFRKRVRNPWSSPTRVVCSELLVRAMQVRRRVDGWEALDPERAYPEDLLVLCLGLQYQEIR